MSSETDEKIERLTAGLGELARQRGRERNRTMNEWLRKPNPKKTTIFANWGKRKGDDDGPKAA